MLLAFPRPVAGSVRVSGRLRAVLDTCYWASLRGEEVDGAALDALARAVRFERLRPRDAAEILHLLQPALRWLDDARCDAAARALADCGGWQSVAGSWAHERATELAGALARLSALAAHLREAAGSGRAPAPLEEIE